METRLEKLFDPNKKEDLDLLLEIFDRLSPEQKDEVREVMRLKHREIAQEHLNDIGAYLSSDHDCAFDRLDQIKSPTQDIGII